VIPAVSVTDVALGYGRIPVLAGVDLTVAPGEVMALLGPSGSGKTTLLHAIAGFVVPSVGEVRLGGRLVSGPGRYDPPERRQVGMVFQNYALWPHLTVLDIVAYPIRRRGLSAAVARRCAVEVLARVDIERLAGRRPAELSGGEQQRVGLARALAGAPRVLLLDEPTAHLDAHLRAMVLAEIAKQRAASGAAAVYATHDAAEALAVADRVTVVHDGRVAQSATPVVAYEQPADLAVARLTGPVSILDSPVRARGAGAVTIDVGGVPATVRCAEPCAGGSSVLVRPEWAELDGDLPGRVTAVRFGGPHTEYELDTPAGTVLIREPGPPRRAPGETAGWSLRRVWLPPGQ
jgi:ABC-type Fe3+/spermidine/putrescine transport system ATPase subunit